MSLFKRYVRPRSSNTNTTTTPRQAFTTMNSMQVLQPEPIVVSARPVSANLPVLQPISLDKLSTIDRARSQYHNQARTSSTSTIATSSFAARSKSNVPSTTSFEPTQDTKIFLTDVAVTPTIDHHNGRNSTRTPVDSNDTAAQLTMKEETAATRDTNETKEAGKTPLASPRATDTIEGRMSHVEETQNQMRAELEKYLQDVRSRTDEEGTALVDFPESFDKDSEQATNRESSWRKFISDRVRNHPDGELDRKTQQKLERGFTRIAELDVKLKAAESKYLESKKNLRQLQAELATPHDSRWDSPVNTTPTDKYDEPQVYSKTKSRPSLKKLTPMEAANAMRGMNSLLTAEEELRVASILAESDGEDDDEEEQDNFFGVAENETKNNNARGLDQVRKKSKIATVYDISERERKIEQQLQEMCIPPPARALVFNEKRNTFLLVKEKSGNVAESLDGRASSVHSNSPSGSSSMGRSSSRRSNVSSSSSSNNNSNGGTDFIAAMREKRLIQTKVKQIDEALFALSNAPLKRSTSQFKGEDVPLSIRAIVQPVTRAEIDDLVQLALAKLPDDGKTASKSDIQKLLSEQVEAVEVVGNFSSAPPPPQSVLEELHVSDEAGAPNRVIHVRPKQEQTPSHKPKKNADGQSSKKHLAKSKSASEIQKSPSGTGKALFGWSLTSTKDSRRTTGKKGTKDKRRRRR